MKHILKKMLCVVLTTAIILSGNVYHMPEVSAAADLNWGLELDISGHTDLKISVSKVDEKQAVTAHITAGADTFTKKLDITSQSQDFEIIFDKGYGPGVKVTAYLETADKRKTTTATDYVGEHVISTYDGQASPKQFTVKESFKGTINNISADVGIKDIYIGKVNGDGTLQVDYPAQNIGKKYRLPGETAIVRRQESIQ